MGSYFEHTPVGHPLSITAHNIYYVKCELGVALLCGIGFTMSIFVGSLAFQEADIGYARIDRLAIVLASLLASVTGYIVLRSSCPKLLH